MPKRRATPSPPPPPPPDDLMRDVKRMLSREQFGSIDEVNAFLQQFMGKPLAPVQPANDRERAEDLVQAARNEPSDAKRRKLISEALALDSDCVAAHLLLAEEAATPPEALLHAGHAVAAGERVLAPLLLEDDAFLWGDTVGRIWLIARAYRAELWWQVGDRVRAVAEVRDLLRQNPGDNQGMRYVLLQWLMRAGSVDEIERLLVQYAESNAAWLFTRALHLYRTEGPSAAATRALRAAIARNSFVLPLLLGRKPMPDELPYSYILGSNDEAVLYVNSAITVWLETEGAMEWVDVNSRGAPAPKRPRRR